MADSKWDEGADAYGYAYEESLDANDPEEAIYRYIDHAWLGTVGIDPLPAVTVCAFKRETVDNDTRESMVGTLLEDIDEWFSEEYGDPENYEPESSGKTEAGNHLRAAIDAYLEGASVWRCKEIGRREYSAAEVEALARVWYPESFAKAGATK